MIGHCYCRVRLCDELSDTYVATCDDEIKQFCISKNYPVIMTSKKHTRCLDRVFEAAKKNNLMIKNEDLVVCVQGDEPMLSSKMIDNVIFPFKGKKYINATVLAMEIIDKKQFYNPDTVKNTLPLKLLYI